MNNRKCTSLLRKYRNCVNEKTYEYLNKRFIDANETT
jgi:hypothetical protein